MIEYPKSGRVTYPNLTNLMPNPFDPENWLADIDGTNTNVVTPNPSGEPFAGLAEQTGAGAFYIASTSGLGVTTGEKEYLSVICKPTGGYDTALRFRFADSQGFLGDTILSGSTGLRLGGGTRSTKVTDLSNGFKLIQVEWDATRDDSNGVGQLIFWSNDNSGEPPVGSQLYVQAAFFGKADDWPAVYAEPLPSPLVDGSLSWSAFDQRRAVTRWTGPSLTTPNGDNSPAVYNLTILCETKAQLDIFVDFYKNTLNYGSEWFNMNLSAAGQVFNQEVNFLGNKPGVTQVDALFRVNMNLVTRIAFRDTQEVTDRALQYLADGYKYVNELPVSDVTFDSTLITFDSTVVTFDESTNPFY